VIRMRRQIYSSRLREPLIASASVAGTCPNPHQQRAPSANRRATVPANGAAPTPKVSIAFAPGETPALNPLPLQAQAPAAQFSPPPWDPSLAAPRPRNRQWRAIGSSQAKFRPKPRRVNRQNGSEASNPPYPRDSCRTRRASPPRRQNAIGLYPTETPARQPNPSKGVVDHPVATCRQRSISGPFNRDRPFGVELWRRFGPPFDDRPRKASAHL
jgi:hypothetical protein